MRPSLTFVNKCANFGGLNGAKFIRRTRRLARKTGQSFHLVTERGKGSHVTVYLDNRLTVVQDRKKEL